MKKIIQVQGVLNWKNHFRRLSINSTEPKNYLISRLEGDLTDEPEIGSLVQIELLHGVLWRIVPFAESAKATALSQSQQSDS